MNTEYLSLFFLDKVLPIGSLIFVSIAFRSLLTFFGQRWVSTYAHTATLTFLPIITYVITKVISGNIALSLGMVGALSIVRFRNPVRSPLELSVYFGAITMGIAASVSYKWFIFLVASLLAATITLAAISVIYRKISGTNFFQLSFTEGSSLSTLEVETTGTISNLEDSRLLQSKTVSKNSLRYFLTSERFDTLKTLIDQVEKDEQIIRYELNS